MLDKGNKYLITSLSLLLILLMAFFLSSRMILAGDFFFLYDQARDFLLVKDIVENLNITLIGSRSGIGGFFHGPLYLYILAPIFIMGKGDPFAFTYFFLLIPLLTVIAGFFIAQRLYNSIIGLILALFLAITPRIWGFVHSTQGLNLIPLVYLFIIYFMILYIRGNNRAFIFAVFFAGLTFQFETATALMLLPVLGVFYVVFGGISALKDYKIILLSLISFSLSVITFILFDLRHNFLMLRSLFSVFGQAPQDGYLVLPERFISHLSSLQSIFASGFIQSNILLLISSIGIIGVFMYQLVKKKIEIDTLKEVFLFASIPFIFFGFYMLYAYPIYSEYVVGLTIPVLFLFSLMIYYTWKSYVGKIFATAFILITCLLALLMIKSQYIDAYPVDRSAGSYRNQKAVVDWVFQDAEGEPFGYFVYTPETFTHGMDYLFWYVAKSRRMNVPRSEKLPLTYLVLYPPLASDYGAHDFWKKNTINTSGEVLSRKIFTGGIIVEKVAIPAGESPVAPTYYQELIFR